MAASRCPAAAAKLVAAEPTHMEFASRLPEPTSLPIGTEGKHSDRLGIPNSGFVPLPLPGGYDFASMSYGVDERVRVSSLTAGVWILKDLFGEC